MMDRALRAVNLPTVDAEAIHKRLRFKNVAPLAYGDGQVVWGMSPGSD